MTGVGVGLPTAAPSAAAGAGAKKVATFNTTIVNPIPERAGKSLTRAYSNIAYAHGFDEEERRR
jgi:hypothetical protein